MNNNIKNYHDEDDTVRYYVILFQRWQIGEIASKIGQLYYHYYLRTSDTNYLSEAFSFYAAIRARGYYSKMVSVIMQESIDSLQLSQNVCRRR